IVLLGLRSTLKPDLGSTLADLVYGTPLRCDGPFPVLEKSPKYYTLFLRGKRETVTIDRLKPAFFSPLRFTNVQASG
ncbi:uncharacterized protein LOC120845269, partial [Ixodes scapularis]|uniref:uncharacterized protein LOC120845269 n=1 Tax=Ixodes scapularis TaxID=6945 RepID=UPI001C38F22A